jgi:hypothetical protein
LREETWERKSEDAAAAFISAGAGGRAERESGREAATGVGREERRERSLGFFRACFAGR